MSLSIDSFVNTGSSSWIRSNLFFIWSFSSFLFVFFFQKPIFTKVNNGVGKRKKQKMKSYESIQRAYFSLAFPTYTLLNVIYIFLITLWRSCTSWVVWFSWAVLWNTALSFRIMLIIMLVSTVVSWRMMWKVRVAICFSRCNVKQHSNTIPQILCSFSDLEIGLGCPSKCQFLHL